MLFVPSLDIFKTLQKENEVRLEAYLDILELGSCKPCWLGSRRGKRPLGYHSTGGFMPVLVRGGKFSQADFNKWLFDLEHGFFHGFMVGFLAYCFMTQTQKERCQWELQHDPIRPKNYHLLKFEAQNYVLGCLFHDFEKVRGEDSHDAALKKRFLQLPEEFYRHSEPLPEDVNKPIIMADRLELMRYPDHEMWCRMDELRPYAQKYGVQELKHLYNHIRPFLSKVFEHRYEAWFSHVPETTFFQHERVEFTGWLSGNVYPLHHWREDLDQYSVNIGKLQASKACLHHNWPSPFVGYISAQNVVRNGGEIRSGPPEIGGRDHPFLKGKLPLKAWNFAYTKIDELNVIDYYQAHFLNLSLMRRLIEVTELLISRFQAFLIDYGAE